MWLRQPGLECERKASELAEWFRVLEWRRHLLSNVPCLCKQPFIAFDFDSGEGDCSLIVHKVFSLIWEAFTILLIHILFLIHLFQLTTATVF